MCFTGLVEGGFVYGFSVVNGDYGSIDISQLFFAYDAFIFFVEQMSCISTL